MYRLKIIVTSVVAQIRIVTTIVQTTIEEALRESQGENNE